MKKVLCLLAVAALLVGQSTAGGEDKQPRKQLHFKYRMCEGDPNGSREAGTLKILAEPQQMTLENRPLQFLLGGEVPVQGADRETVEYAEFGRRFECKPGRVRDGRVTLAVKLLHITVEERSDERVSLQMRGTETFSTVKLGEVTRFHWAKTTGEKPAWIDVTVTEVVLP